jgi:hypothetical protein
MLTAGMSPSMPVTAPSAVLEIETPIEQGRGHE